MANAHALCRGYNGWSPCRLVIEAWQIKMGQGRIRDARGKMQADWNLIPVTGSSMNNNQATKGAAIWCQFPLYFSSSQMVITPHRSKCARRFNLTLYWLDLIVGMLKDTLPLSGNTKVVVENWGLVMGIWSQLSSIKTEHADLALTNIRISRYFRI